MSKLEQLKLFLTSRKKGLTLGSLPQLFYTVMVIGAFVGATYIMLENFQNSTDNTSSAYTGIGYILTFVDNIVTNLPTVGVIIFIVILVGVILWLRTSRGRGGA